MVARRDSAISGYCIQLGMMERLRHELLLLHNKVHYNVHVLWSDLPVLNLTSWFCFTVRVHTSTYSVELEPSCLLHCSCVHVWWCAYPLISPSYLLHCSCVFVYWQVQSQEELIGVLSQQLREVRQEKASLQLEFSQYRKHSQVGIFYKNRNALTQLAEMTLN